MGRLPLDPLPPSNKVLVSRDKPAGGRWPGARPPPYRRSANQGRRLIAIVSTHCERTASRSLGHSPVHSENTSESAGEDSSIAAAIRSWTVIAALSLTAPRKLEKARNSKANSGRKRGRDHRQHFGRPGFGIAAVDHGHRAILQIVDNDEEAGLRFTG